MPLFGRKKKLTLPDSYAAADEGDRAVLQQLVGLGADLAQPRHVVHYIYVPTAEVGDAAAATARDGGWSAESAESAAGDGQWCVLAEQHGYVLSPETVIADRAFFLQLAATHSGDYDGWEASLS